MMFAEPPPSQGDLHFSLFGIPVRVHPLFWLIALVLGLMGSSQMSDVFVWAAAMLVAILIHELGHALAMRRLGLRPWIVLHGMGGLTACDTAQWRNPRASHWASQIVVSAAGPAAGFLLAAAVIAVLHLSGHPAWISFDRESQFFFSIQMAAVGSRTLSLFVYFILFISVIWGAFNLLPVYPLDGGHIAREVFLRIDTRSGIRRSLVLSTVTAAALAVVSLARVVQAARVAADLGAEPGSAMGTGGLWIAILFGYMAYSSYMALQAYDRSGPRW